MHQLKMDLQGRITKQSGQLGFRNNLCGHQIQHDDLKGTNILRRGSGLSHDKDILLLQHFCCRQIIWNPYGHGSSLFWSFSPF
jgi:hypothetical protein